MKSIPTHCQYFKTSTLPNTICIWEPSSEIGTADRQLEFNKGVSDYLVSSCGFGNESFTISNAETLKDDFQGLPYRHTLVTFFDDGITMAELQGFMA
jgi:hypothetical protein